MNLELRFTSRFVTRLIALFMTTSIGFAAPNNNPCDLPWGCSDIQPIQVPAISALPPINLCYSLNMERCFDAPALTSLMGSYTLTPPSGCDKPERPTTQQFDVKWASSITGPNALKIATGDHCYRFLAPGLYTLTFSANVSPASYACNHAAPAIPDQVLLVYVYEVSISSTLKDGRYLSINSTGQTGSDGNPPDQAEFIYQCIPPPPAGSDYDTASVTFSLEGGQCTLIGPDNHETNSLVVKLEDGTARITVKVKNPQKPSNYYMQEVLTAAVNIPVSCATIQRKFTVTRVDIIFHELSEEIEESPGDLFVLVGKRNINQTKLIPATVLVYPTSIPGSDTILLSGDTHNIYQGLDKHPLAKVVMSYDELKTTTFWVDVDKVSDYSEKYIIAEHVESVAKDKVSYSCVLVDLDVGSETGGEPDEDVDDPVDGITSYLPGYRGGEPCLSFAFAEKTLASQNVKLILFSSVLSHAQIQIEYSSSLAGYSTNTVLPDSSEANSDCSFQEDSYSWISVVPFTSGKAIQNVYVKDYGALCKVKISLHRDGNYALLHEFTLSLPVDDDGDGIADLWEEQQIEAWNTQYEEALTGGITAVVPGHDSEKNDPDGSGGDLSPHKTQGDGLSVFMEYRGFYFESTPEWGGEQGHRRLSACRKELLVEVDRCKDAIESEHLIYSMSKAKSVFSNSCGVDLYYIADNMSLPEKDFREHVAASTFCQSNFETNPNTRKGLFVYLLFANSTNSGTKEEGIYSQDYSGAIISCAAIYNSKPGGQTHLARFSEIYGIQLNDRFASIVTHELGHTVNCLDYYFYHPRADKVVNFRIDPSYCPNTRSVLLGLIPQNRQYNLVFYPDADVRELNFDFLSGANVNISQLVEAINSMSGKYGAYCPVAAEDNKPWELELTQLSYDLLKRLPSDTPHQDWTTYNLQYGNTSVMTYEWSAEKYNDVKFTNDTSSPAYQKELQRIDFKNRLPKL